MLESFRPPERGIQDQSLAARGESASRRGAGRHVRLVAICGPIRHHHRDAPFWCLGANQGFAEEIRVHRGERSRGGPKSIGEIKKSSVVGLQSSARIWFVFAYD